MLEQLTSQERRILKLIAAYWTNKEIAAHLHVHHRTVETHRHNMRQKLDLRGHQALLNFAVRYKDEL